MKLYGAIPALATPFKKGDVDLPAMRKLVRAVIDGGCSGVVSAGCTGEAATLTESERTRLLETVLDEAKGKIPVIVGTGTNSTAETIKRTKWAKQANADAALVITPYYNKPTQAGLIAHYTAVAEAVDLPLIIYNVPSRTGVSTAPETVARLSELPTVIAIKEASGSLDQVSAIKSMCQITVLSGDDSLTLPMLAVGATGVISVVANIAPAEVARMIQRFQEGALTEARLLHNKLFPLIKAMFIETNPGPVKYALKVLGYGSGELRLPLVPVSQQAAHLINETLLKYGYTLEVA